MMVCSGFNLVSLQNYLFNYTNYIDAKIVQLASMKRNNTINTEAEKCVSETTGGCVYWVKSTFFSFRIYIYNVL